jgi:Family of unknown function (DUF6163)
MTAETAPGPGGGSNFIDHAPLPAIPDVGALTPEDAKAARWTMILVWFMRTISVVWLFKGLFDWSILLGADPAVANVLELPGPMAAMICFFAVADLVAAVGLWLAAPWGGVLWLLCAAIEAAGPVFGARASMASNLAIGLDLALIAVYFTLNFMAARERQ